MSYHTIPKKTTLRMLHTSDWHLGKRLHNHSRYDEFAQFLSWLIDTINAECVDVLIVAGDIFDTMTPSNRAQELYYNFLGLVAKSSCRHVVITAGNHDSPTFLDAPKSILRSLNVRVVGSISDNICDDVFCLHNPQGQAEAIIIAAPYLRDKDVRDSSSFDAVGTKEYDTIQGIAEYYAQLTAHAKALQADIIATQGTSVPIIATGHLFVAGSSIADKNDGMRDLLYVGTIGQIHASIFDESLHYVALGHIHAPQKVANQDRIRYCGSPIAMSFGEIGKTKQVLLIDFEACLPIIHSIAVPVFQPLIRISGDWQTIEKQLHNAIDMGKDTGKSVLAEIIYTADELEPHLTKKIRHITEGSQVIVLNINNKTQYQYSLSQSHKGEQLKHLSEIEVFDKLLQRHEITSQESHALKIAHQTILTSLHEDDSQAI
ncbi:MAG: exonuclease SbcCD subunit D C-terminal domain-containing protein [Moraxella sp.]|nr:exonuclease SbcCD subunit D C-terminal domain-containing protein [Moraxella sp.]